MDRSRVIVLRWWTDASVAQAWPLLQATAAWPGWWSRLREVRVAQRGAAGRANRRWRLLLGRPLHLVVATLSSEPQAVLSVRLGGDLQGQLTLLLESASGTGVHITCRCEWQVPRGGLHPWVLLTDRRRRQLLQVLARDLARALHCRAKAESAWLGTGWQG